MQHEAKLVCGLIGAPDCEIEKVRTQLEKEFGAVDLESNIFPFDFTDYYEKELGIDLKRQWISFEKLITQEDLKSIKQATIKMEKDFTRDNGTRTVKIDPGYLELSKLVLATTKNYSHRIYLGNGIFAEITLIYKDHHFQPLEWTYPDYQKNTQFFEQVRDKFKINHG